MSRYARHQDRNHREVIDALEAVGASVQAVSPNTTAEAGVPDLLVGYRGETFLLEVKDGEAKDKRQRRARQSQLDWHAWWRGRPVVVVLSVDEALRAIGASVRAA